MKFKSLLILFSLILNFTLLAQSETPTKFPIFQDDKSYDHSLIIQCANDDILFIWRESDQISFSRSTNDGVTWTEAQILENDLSGYSTWSDISLTGIITSSGRILFAYKPDNFFKLRYSDNNGETWSESINLPPFSVFTSSTGSLWEDDSTAWFIFTANNRIYDIKSTDNGITWSNQHPFVFLTNQEFISNPFFFKSNENLLLIYNVEKGDSSIIYKRISTDGGLQWSDPSRIFETDSKIFFLSGVQNANEDITLVFEKAVTTPFNNIFQTDIFSLNSTDAGLTWSPLKKITNYVGRDSYPELSTGTEDHFISFASTRGNEDDTKNLWYGKINSLADTNAPPRIYRVHHTIGADNLSISIKAFADDDVQLDSVLLYYKVNENVFPPLVMFDDGQHEDELANDKIFGIRLANFNNFDKLEFYIRAIDNQQNAYSTLEEIVYFSELPILTSSIIDVNKIKLPIDNRGVLASVNIPGIGSGGKYDESTFLFSGGFLNSGYSNGNMWSTGQATASLIENYLPGPVGSNPENLINKLYIIKNSDASFGDSWLDWKLAVSLGANFYDGNTDGIYNPIDLNYNGLWDPNEDRPDLQGDVTAWCVYNDGKPESDRNRFPGVEPQGIEVRQSLFASEGAGTSYENIIFVRYELINTGTEAEVFDSVYFAAAADPDLGTSYDDLVGCDTTENSGYIYNDGSDQLYGINPPAFFIKQLQGPPVFIPGETFIDNNFDGEFTLGIDTPLDSAVVKRGKYLGVKYIQGAKNLYPTSFMHYQSSDPDLGDPSTKEEARNYLLGLDRLGNIVDPCTWTLGNGNILSNCSEINPKFLYSGDPVSGDGWINTTSTDQRMILSTGPFQIKVGKPIELIYAYIVGRGTDHLNSITKAREISQFAQTVYDNNFEDLPTGVNEDENLIVNDFKLFQNYPNPFNPTTTIKFTVPSSVMLNSVQHLNSEIPKQVRDDNSIVQLKIYDILGREINTLVNEVKSAGIYEIKFDASSLSSGVYFYQLKAGSFIQTKKMMLIK